VQKNVCVPLFTDIQLRWTAESRNLIVILLFTHTSKIQLLDTQQRQGGKRKDKISLPGLTPRAKGGELNLGGLFCPLSFPFVTAVPEPVFY